MNGRMYDPLVGRFLSPDPYVQVLDFSQSFNRYSYCLNNPLIYTDPDGEFFFAAVGIGIYLNAACWGAVLYGGMYTLNAAVSPGGLSQNWNSNDFWRTVGIGAASGVINTALTMYLPDFSAKLDKFYSTLREINAEANKWMRIVDYASSLTGYNKDSERLTNAFKIDIGGILFSTPLDLFIPWERNQKILGNTISHLRNFIGHVDNVELDWRNRAVLVNRQDERSGHAFTIGPYINSRNVEVGDDLYNHELGHTKQSKILGPLYLTKVALPSVTMFWLAEPDYRQNCWYEVWANRLGHDSSRPQTYRRRNFWYWFGYTWLPIFPY